MANKYCNLVATNKIKNEYTKIAAGFAGVEVDVEAAETRMNNHVAGTAEKHKSEEITLESSRFTATNVKAGLEQVDARVDNIITGGGPDKDAEVVDARNSAEYGIFTTLKDRLDNEETERAADDETLQGSIDNLAGAGRTTETVKEAHDFISAHAAENEKHLNLTYEGKRFIVNNPYTGGLLSLKGQLHCHTNNSDGVNTPAVLAAAYRDAGFNFITITDHDYITPDPEISGSLTWIGQGIEENIYGKHICAYDISAQSTATNTQDVLDFYKLNNKMTSIAHPYNVNWYVMDENEVTGLYNYNFMEVWNYDLNAEAQLDYALSVGRKTFCTAVDDCHDIAGLHFNKGWVIVHANANSKSAILESLRKGNFYASNGNDITISVTGEIITATSAGSSNISFIGKNGKVLKTENGVTTSSYTIIGDEMYVRIKSVKVSDSTVAWSQAIFLDPVNIDSEIVEKIHRSQPTIIEPLIINGNFDVAQLATSATNLNFAIGNYNAMLADRWQTAFDANSGTAPTRIESIEPYNPSEPVSKPNLDGQFTARNCYRINLNGAGTSLGNSSYAWIRNRIEHGVSLYTGLAKKVTISLWARSTIANKKIGVYLQKSYGTGGSPSSLDTINGTYFTLNQYWHKYTYTFDTYTGAAKVLGTNNNDFLTVGIGYQWGSTYAARMGDTVAESYGGSGDIYIAHVDLWSGNYDLLNIPQSYLSTFQSCQRYRYRAEAGDCHPCIEYSTNVMYFWIPTQVPLAVLPTNYFGTETTDWKISTLAGVGQTGFTLAVVSYTSKGVLMSATKNSHGLTSGTLKIVTSNNWLTSELN